MRVLPVSTFRHLDQYIPVFDSYGEFRDTNIKVEMTDAGAAIVPSAVPRTDEEIFLQDALAEGAAAAGTDSVEGVDFAIEIAEGVGVAAY